MREAIETALKEALKKQDKTRVSTLRLIRAAVQDRDIAHRGEGRDPVSDDEILLILAQMVKQRQESAKAFEQGGRPELVAQERAEIAVIRDFMPQQLNDEEIQAACRETIARLGAHGLRDMGRCIDAMKEEYAGRMDFSRAGPIMKSLLQ